MMFVFCFWFSNGLNFLNVKMRGVKREKDEGGRGGGEGEK